MDTNRPLPSSLPDILKHLDPELAKKYDFIHQEIEKNIQGYTSLAGELPKDGSKHCQNVIANINLLLPDAIKSELSEQEIFLLLCAIQLHRIGLLYERETNEPKQYIAREYPERTYDYLHEHYEAFNLSKPEAGLVKQICLGLALPHFHELPKTQQLKLSKIRVQFLAALLRLGDVLDVDYTTVSNYLLSLREFSSKSIEQFTQRADIVGVEIDATRWDIKVHIAPETAEGRRLVKRFVEEELQEELEVVSSVLDDHGLHYTVVRAELVHDIVKRDARVFDAIQSYYHLEHIETKTSPYKFLDYFEPNDRDIFFGRRSDIDRFLGYIRRHKLVTLYGESGVGKTSVVNAGLIPELVDEGHIPIYSRCFDEPVKVIINETVKLMSRIAPTQIISLDGSLVTFFEQITRIGYKFVIFVDQFEEFFIKFPHNIQDDFITQLIECLNHTPALNVTFVLSLRREYFVELGRYKSRLLELFNNAFELRKLTKDEIQEAIIKPALKLNIHYEVGLVQVLVQDIYRGGLFNTPHIQIVCDKLVGALGSTKDTLITSTLYNGLGGARKILAEYLDIEMNKFPTQKQADAKSILKEMVTSHRTKTVSTVSEIALRCQIPVEATENLLLELVNHSRLVRKLEVQGETVFELSHEFLVERVGEWLAEDDIDVKAIYEMLNRQLIEKERFGFYLDRERLGQIKQHRDRLKLEKKSKLLILESYLNIDPMSEDKWFWIESLDTSVAVNMLVEAMDTTNSLTYWECISSLSQIGETAINTLVSFLSSQNWQIRQGVIESLVAIGTPSTHLLIDNLALASSDRRTRRGVSTVLARLEEINIDR